MIGKYIKNYYEELIILGLLSLLSYFYFSTFVFGPLVFTIYDKIFHFVVGLLFGMLHLSLIKPEKMNFLAKLSFAMFYSVMFELIRFYQSYYGDLDLSNYFDGIDQILDLVSTTLGVLTVFIWKKGFF